MAVSSHGGEKKIEQMYDTCVSSQTVRVQQRNLSQTPTRNPVRGTGVGTKRAGLHAAIGVDAR